MPKPHSTPRADVLAEEYRGTYLWEQLDKARARIAQLEEQLETLKKANAQLARENAHELIAKNARLQEQLEAAEQAREQLTNALAFYADFEESGHSSWSMATDTLEALYGAIPQPDEPIPALSYPAREPEAS